MCTSIYTLLVQQCWALLIIDSYRRGMFYNYGNLKTELTFSHYDMDKLHSDEEIIKKLKEKVEGRCLPDYGYLIQVTNPELIKISVPHVRSHGCVVVITFSAITFKPQKNDVIDVIVCEISEEFIKGKIGHAQVMIPRSKMPQSGCEYRSNENVYVFRDEQTNEEVKIDKDSKIRCRCFEIKTELNFQMKIIGHVDERLINSMQN